MTSTGTGTETIKIDLPIGHLRYMRAANNTNICFIELDLINPSGKTEEFKDAIVTLRYKGVKKIWRGDLEIKEPGWKAQAKFTGGDKAAGDSMSFRVIME